MDGDSGSSWRSPGTEGRGRAILLPGILILSALALSTVKIVGYDFAEGRSEEEHMEAWRRWYAAEYKAP